MSIKVTCLGKCRECKACYIKRPIAMGVKDTKYFATSGAAWVFMRECDSAGIPAGYPSLTDNNGKGYSVQYMVPSNAPMVPHVSEAR